MRNGYGLRQGIRIKMWNLRERGNCRKALDLVRIGQIPVIDIYIRNLFILAAIEKGRNKFFLAWYNKGIKNQEEFSCRSRKTINLFQSK